MNILRNKFLNTTLLLLRPDDGSGSGEQQEDNRSEAQKQRDAISVDSTVNDNDKTNDDENNEDENEDEDEDEEDENSDDDDKKSENIENETEEEKTARLAKEKENERAKRKADRQQRKWDKLAGEKKAAEEERDALKRQLAEKPVEGLTEEEVVRRAKELVDQELAKKRDEDDKKLFETNVDKLAAAAVKIDKDFDRKISDLVEEIGHIPRTIIDVLADLDHDNGGAVLAHLADNVDEAEDLFKHRDNPRKLDRELTKLSDKLYSEDEANKKSNKRERSRVPPPIRPVNEGNRNINSDMVITGQESQEEFNRKRAIQEKAKREARGY